MTGRVRRRAVLALLLLAAGCAHRPPAPVTVRLIAFNDLHGNLEPPRQKIDAPDGAGGTIAVPAGGAAYLASAIAALKSTHPNHAVVSAGDLIGASPLVSALFLDEPTIAAVSAMGIDFNAVGNHEFDKGRDELLRMARGGCAQHTVRTPCAVEPFAGARFGFLAANVLTGDGRPLFPAYGLKSFGAGRAKVTIGFIGMTLEGTPRVVTPAGVAGLRFADEADTVNALIPELRARGATAIVVVVHEGATTTGAFGDKPCPGLAGDLPPILDRLDPAVDAVISGHTHKAYVCDYPRPGRPPLLLTSAGQYGTLLTAIDLTFTGGKLTARAADNLIVQGEPYTGSAGEVPLTDRYPRYPKDAAVAALIARYAAAAAPLAGRLAGKLTGPATRTPAPSREHVMGNLIADAQLAATRSPATGGARLALMNPGGVRADLVPAPDGSVTYGQLFAVQPFGNNLVVKSFTGAQLKALLEQQFAAAALKVLLVSNGVRYAYNLSQPPGARVSALTLDGAPVDPAASYRVTMNAFLASGGDGFTVFNAGTDSLGGAQDIDALEAYVAANAPLTPPAADRITDATPATAP